MKPLRSKRAGPAARARGDSACRSSSPASLGFARTGQVGAAAADACTSPGRGARDRQPRPAEGLRAGSSVTSSGADGELIARSATPTELPRKGREPRPPRTGLRLPSPAGLPGVHCTQWSLRDDRRWERRGGTWRLGSPSEAGRLLDPS